MFGGDSYGYGVWKKYLDMERPTGKLARPQSADNLWYPWYKDSPHLLYPHFFPEAK